nr:hypothetical protein I308_01897 [Cryptococcus tetragattii IND107]
MDKLMNIANHAIPEITIMQGLHCFLYAQVCSSTFIGSSQQEEEYDCHAR